MDRGTVSGRYAKALYRYAHKHGQERSVYDSTVALNHSYLQYEALRRTLANPILAVEEKEKLIALAAGREVSEEFRQFVRLVIRQKREDFLQMICLSYQEIYRVAHKLLHVDIVTAVPVDAATEKAIADRLEQLTHETVDIRSTVDPSIIGGYILRWDTYRWDASVTSQLRQIKKELKDSIKME